VTGAGVAARGPVVFRLDPGRSGALLDGERVAWVGLAAVEGIGERWFGLLVATFGSAGAVLTAALDERRDGALPALLSCGRTPGLPAPVAVRIREAARDPTAAQRAVEAIDGWTMTPLDPDYPDRLRALDPMPPLLFGLGDRRLLSASRAVAVVGTRRPTAVGRLLAARIADRLAAAGAVVVSGLAIGIDGAAHAATVEAGGRTVGVVGGGLDRPGPTAHRRLVRAILDRGGTIVGEHPIARKPTRGTFPRRNRIISGLTDATVVVEAPGRSGALITARHAREQGRVVMAVPGRPSDPSVAGCLALLRETPARPVAGLDELLVDLELDVGGAAAADAPTGGATAGGARRSDGVETATPRRHLDALGALATLSGAERAVAQRLVRGPASADAIVAATSLPPPVVAGALTLLGLRGWTHPLGPLHLPAGPLLRTARGPPDRRSVRSAPDHPRPTHSPSGTTVRDLR
jgi:DNA processing protein